jgi:phospholipid/cholesterol/gamma-HCH transport system permease protein
MASATTESSHIERRSVGTAVFEWCADWGKLTMDGIVALGDITLFSLSILGWMFWKRPKLKHLMPSFYQIGVLSLPVIALTGVFIGMVLALQSYVLYRQLGFETRLGAVINVSLLRELGPVLAATMLAGRIGSSIAAELGTMRVTEQIDALSTMGTNPIAYLVVPRFLACFLLIPMLTIMANFMGVVGGFFYSVVILGIDQFHYQYNAQQFVGPWDLFYGLIKSLFFGATIAIVSCYRGFHCTPGAEGVGRAATASFVLSFVVILILDFSVGVSLDAIHEFFYPYQSRSF